MFLFRPKNCVIYKDRTIFIQKINVGRKKKKRKRPILWTRKEDKCEKTGHLADDSLVALGSNVLFDFRTPNAKSTLGNLNVNPSGK